MAPVPSANPLRVRPRISVNRTPIWPRKFVDEKATRSCASHLALNQALKTLTKLNTVSLAELKSEAAHQEQYDDDNEDDADDADPSVSVTVAISTKAAAETAEQEDNKEDNEYETDRHRSSPLRAGSAKSIHTIQQKYRFQRRIR
jgi:hypothetical protein